MSKNIKEILRVIFFRDGIQKTLVSDNTPVFCDKDLSLWLQKMGCKLYKTPPYPPQSNGLAEIMVQTVKTQLKAFSQEKKKKISTKAVFKLSHNTTCQKTRKPINFNRTAN